MIYNTSFHFPFPTYFIVCRNFCLLEISAGIFAKIDFRSKKKIENALLGTVIIPADNSHCKQVKRHTCVFNDHLKCKNLAHYLKTTSRLT